MKFGNFSVDRLSGAMLAHSVRLPSGLLKKGHILTESDIRALGKNNITHVIAAIPDASDMTEDEAAREISDHIAGDHITCAEAFTGRVNLYAAADGLVKINAAAVNQLNHQDEAITLATISPHAIVRTGQMVATVKIIPLAAERQAVINLVADTAGRLLNLHPFQPQTAIMIQTVLSGTTEKLFEKAKRVMTHRLAAFATALVDDVKCAHEEKALADLLLERTRTDHDMILIMGASAITDRRDVIPAAIMRAGGQIIHYGMPVDPGNLMLLAKLHGKWVLGLPGCS
ncbi:MAG: molybdopterin-binding protein, partial [Alphaproteobacteria bacterium]|nr:molybdopterin-binding protein [Alphaproteobacteria bacterium]